MRKKVNKKLIVALLSFVLLFGGTFGSSLAWLLDNTEDVTNTFSASEIDIELDESDNLDLKMVPGDVIGKDPFVTVKKDSEDCWVFIKVEESDNLDDYISYAIDTTVWTQLTDADGNDVENVYYTSSLSNTEDRTYYVLGSGSEEFLIGEEQEPYSWANNQVLTKPDVTKEMMAETMPTLTFTAYASQYKKNHTDPFEPYEAWAIAKPATP